MMKILFEKGLLKTDKSKLLLIYLLLALFFNNSAFSQDFPSTDYEEYVEPETYSEYQPAEEPIPAPPPKPLPAPPIRMAQKVVMIGRVPYMSVKEMMAHVKSLLGYLRKEMGVKEVRLVTSKDYTSIIEALARGTIDFAWLGPTAYVLGTEKIGLIPLAKTKRRNGSSYRGVFITLKSSQILGLEDIKGKVFGFVDPESASGYFYPLYVLKRAKINPFKFCKTVKFLKKHDLILAALLEKKIDAGVCLEDTLGTLKYKADLAKIMVLGKTDEVPSDVIACREDCPINLRDKFKEALLKIQPKTSSKNDGKEGEMLAEFLPTSDAEFNSVRNVLKAIKDIDKGR